ncbi:MAG: zinc ribbon domain-containing protein [Lachnospiraceae bacterium]|nr:zinc ribbon domain-containing protein [Lachnospiraceae bacterium]
MAFWDELKEKITQGSQEAIQKTRDIAEVMQTNASISESRRKINELYLELGQVLVKEAFDGMTSEDLAAILDDETADGSAREIVLRNWREIYTKVRFIRSEEEVIAISENKINELKAEERCPSCGSKIPKGVAYCPECGTKLIRNAPAYEQTQDSVQPAEQEDVPESFDTLDFGPVPPVEEDPQSGEE